MDRGPLYLTRYVYVVGKGRIVYKLTVTEYYISRVSPRILN